MRPRIHRVARMSILVPILACGLAIEAARADIYACAGDSIRVFAQSAAAGDLPVRVIAGPATGITECYGIALDTLHGELWVAHGALSVFRSSATGDVAPLRRIEGPSAGVGAGGSGFAGSVAVDIAGDEVVAAVTGGLILAFPRTGNGNIAPVRAMQIGTFVNTPAGVFVDRIHDEILVVPFTGTGVYAFSRLHTGPAPLVRPPISVSDPRALFLDRDTDHLYVTAPAGVMIFDRAGALLGTLGASGALTSPWGLTITPDEALVGNQSMVSADPDPIYFYTMAPPGQAPTHAIQTGAPGNRSIFGITTSAARNCAAGNVADDCLFRDGVEGGNG